MQILSKDLQRLVLPWFDDFGFPAQNWLQKGPPL